MCAGIDAQHRQPAWHAPATQAARVPVRVRPHLASTAANKERLPAIPDLSDNSGGLSNPVFFNFVRCALGCTAQCSSRLCRVSSEQSSEQ